jgi:ATP-dependent Clp protease ATP-binding subunit ClpA
LLWDEIDKAHPDVTKLLLQILDEGEITDASGKKINLEHAVIILTTNLGAELFKSSGIGFDKNNKQELETQILSRLKNELSPAIISRLDSTVIFSPLNEEIVKKIISKNIEDLNNELISKKKFLLSPDDKSLSAIAHSAFSADEGARQVDKVLQDIIQDLLIKIVRDNKHKNKYKLTYTGNEYKLV